MIALLFWACGPAVVGVDPPTQDTGSDPLEEPFPWERVLQVDVTVDPDDWDALRTQGRNLGDILGGDCLAQEFDKPWSWFDADVTVDGDRFPTARVRKKGFLGSLSETRPSLKVRFDQGGDQLWRGLDRLTLNNSRQDASRLNTCLAYEVFRSAGVPAPRCSYAQVWVNGESLGLYANVESVREPFLTAQFGDPTGEHWEGTVSDFRTEYIGTFEDKNDAAKDSDGASLDAIRAILEDAPDETLLDDLDAWIDVDAYLTFWATEILVGHWDGYASNTNNYFLYRDPADDRFDFMPWGTDAVLHGSASAVAANGILARRLYLHDDGRQAYLDRMQELLDTVWDEDGLLAEVDRLEDLVGAIASEDNDGFADSVDGIREFLTVRRSDVQSQLDDGGPSWTQDLRGTPCFVESGTVAATFETDWGSWQSTDPWGEGTSDPTILWEGQQVPWIDAGAIAGDPGDGTGAVGLTVQLDESSLALAYLNGAQAHFAGPGALPVDFGTLTGALYYADAASGYEFQFLGYLFDGDVVLDESGTATGDAVRGSLELSVVNWGW